MSDRALDWLASLLSRRGAARLVAVENVLELDSFISSLRDDSTGTFIHAAITTGDVKPFVETGVRAIVPVLERGSAGWAKRGRLPHAPSRGLRAAAGWLADADVLARKAKMAPRCPRGWEPLRRLRRAALGSDVHAGERVGFHQPQHLGHQCRGRPEDDGPAARDLTPDLDDGTSPRDVQERQLAQVQREDPAVGDGRLKSVEEAIRGGQIELADEKEAPIPAELPDVERPISSDLERPIRGHGVLHEDRERQRCTAADAWRLSGTGHSRVMANFVPTNVGGHPYSSQIESTSRRPGRARRLDLSVVAHAHTDAPGGLRHSHPNVRDGACRGTLTGSELRRIRISGGVRD